jgi:hypothetical protein
MPEQRRLKEVIRRAVDNYDAIPAGEFMAQVISGNQPARAASEDDYVSAHLPAGTLGHRPEGGLRLRLNLGRLLVELFDGGGETRFLELTLPQNYLPVRSYEDGIGHPAIAELFKDRSVLVRYNIERQIVLFFPLVTAFLRFKGTDIYG